ncbi:MAG: hypothetical protein KKB03_00470 [Nanoarchaeota archaeon]|nr:hypothetical protein [Nanoarchaeota archaeon]MBU1135339.1 hypothetical protein [Nanoarchaeota archaeon]MBU2519703.1 hypothetical protein [Nanoarchaeota archaeon]
MNLKELREDVYRFVDKNTNGLSEDGKGYLADKIYREFMFFYNMRDECPWTHKFKGDMINASCDWWEDCIEDIRVNY